MKVSSRTKVFIGLWVVATAIMAILTDQNDWSSTPLIIVTVITFLAFASSIFIDNLR